MKKYLFVLLLVNVQIAFSQLVFQKNYGGASNEEANGIIAESDHTFFIVGSTVSYGQGGGGEDAMHFKTDAAGNIIYNTTYGVGTLRDRARHVIKTADGGYLVTGDKLFSGAADDYFVQKLNSAGTQTAMYLYGDNNIEDEEAFAGQEIPALNYYINFGFTTQYGGGGQDAFFKIIQNTGAHVASRYFGGAGWADAAFDGFFNTLNGIFLAGRTNSVGAGGFDGMVIRTSSVSPYNITWQRAIGSTGEEEFLSMKEVTAGGVICVGYTTGLGAVGEDIFICRIALGGGLTWSRRIGGAGNERARAVWPTADGGFIVAGYTTSAGAGGEDGFLLKLASDGSTEWARVYGGASNERFNALAIRPSSFGYAAVGYSETFTNGGRDFYFVATDINGNTNCHQANWNPTNVTVSPTVTTTGINVVTTGHSSFSQSFLTTNPSMPVGCRCIEERPRIDIAGPSTVCRNQTGVNYSITPVTGVTNYNWTATNATITSPTNGTNITVNFGTSNAQIIVQAVYGNCSNFDIDTINVTIDPITATISGTSPICFNQSSSLTANAVNPQSGVSAYSWSNLATTQTISVTPPVGSNTYTVTITDGLGCTATSSFTVNVNPLPTPGIITNSPVCAGQTIALQGTGGTGYSWSGPNAFTSSIQNPTIANAQAINAGTYTVTVTGANGCTSTTTASVVVNPLPTPTAGSNSPVCVGQTITLNASGGVSYSWSGPNAFSNNTQNPSISNAQLVNAGTYTVTVTDANSCSASASTAVTVNPLPTPSIGSNSPVCVGQTIILNAGGGVSYSWSGPNAFSSNTQNPSISNAQLVNAGTYTVTVTDANSCSATATTAVTVNPLPTPSIGSNSPVCIGQIINLNAGGGVSYSWSGPNAFSSTSQNPAISNAQLINAGTYTVTVTDANNCSSSTSTNIIINSLPNASATNNGPLCETNTLQLNASGGVSYVWIGPNGFNANTQNPSISNVTLAENGIYTVTVTGANGCTNTATTTVVVSPDLVVSINSNSPICVGSTLTLTSMPGSSHQWTGPASFNSSVENPSINNVTLANAGTYTVIVTNAQGCSGSASVNVIINSNPLVNLGPDTTVCNTQTVLLDAGNAGANFFWSDGSSNQTLLVGSAGTYTVTVTDGNGCSSSDEITVNYQPLPVVDLGADQTLCLGSSIQIGDTHPGATYTWNTGATTAFITVTTGGTYTLTVSLCNTSVSDNITITLDSLNVLLVSTVTPDCGQNNGSITVNPVNGIGTISFNWPADPTQTTAQLTNIASGSYTVIVTDQAGCTAALTTTLGCNSPNLDIPQFLSPNGDGKNDVWVINNLPTDFPNNQVKIFNRWGNEVFVANPYLNDWDGRPNTVISLGSNILPAGTYFYVLDLYGDGSDVRTGFIELNP
ncbi:MAG: gliding motility-associated C-terminal domain-containing protein [Flavobacteriales bacterium]|nr:gliding motility-associated C-terminal domain-containing protein [Flavobacteriales bacterium]